jgi:hypothetical protein
MPRDRFRHTFIAPLKFPRLIGAGFLIPRPNLRDHIKGHLLFLFGHREGKWCITHKANDPSDIVDPNVGMCPLKLQPRLRCLEKPPCFGIAHEPLTPLLLPSRTGTYFAPEIDKCRAPDKSNGWHALRPPHVLSRESYGIDESRCNTIECNVRSISTDMVATQIAILLMQRSRT